MTLTYVPLGLLSRYRLIVTGSSGLRYLRALTYFYRPRIHEIPLSTPSTKNINSSTPYTNYSKSQKIISTDRVIRANVCLLSSCSLHTFIERNAYNKIDTNFSEPSDLFYPKFCKQKSFKNKILSAN